MKHAKADIELFGLKLFWPCETSQLVDKLPALLWRGCSYVSLVVPSRHPFSLVPLATYSNSASEMSFNATRANTTNVRLIIPTVVIDFQILALFLYCAISSLWEVPITEH